jgi:hypothetical protein
MAAKRISNCFRAGPWGGIPFPLKINLTIIHFYFGQLWATLRVTQP